MKKILGIFLSLFLVFGLTSCDKALSDSEKVVLFQRALGDETLTYIDHDTYQKFIDEKYDFVLLLAQTTCSHCTAFKPILEEFVNKNGAKIYVLDTLALDILQYDYTPCLVFYKNGELINKVDPTENEKIFEKLDKLEVYMYKYVNVLE